MTTSHMTTSHEVDREYRGYREYRPLGEAAEPKSVVKALALIGAAIVVGAGAVAGMAFLSMPLPLPLPAHPTVVGGVLKPSAVVASAGAIPASRSSVIFRV
jgi:hypothetical protein